jgi:hypothetical protein
MMPSISELLERESTTVDLEPGDFERLVRRRDRKRRNRRIVAGVVGIAAFVAAVWIVTSVASLDRSEKSVVPAGTGPVQTRPAETRPVAETGPAEAAPPPAPASAAPDVVEQRTCGGDAGARLELTDLGSQIKLRFEVHRSPVGHSWYITIFHGEGMIRPYYKLVFHGFRVAGDSGDFSVQLRTHDRPHLIDLFAARATDTQLCRVHARV